MNSRRHKTRLLTPRRALLATLVAWIAVRMCVPLHPVASLDAIAQRLRLAIGPQLPDPLWLAIAGRFVCFVPVGLLLAGRREPGRLAAPLLAGGLIVALLEATQAAFIGRHPRLFDLTVGLVAISVGIVLGPRLRPVTDALRTRFASRVPLLGLLVATEALVVVMIAQAHRGVGIAGWDLRYPLLIGNEETLDRPWRGEIAAVSFCDYALDPNQVARLWRWRMAGAADADLPFHRLAVYDFRRSTADRVRPLSSLRGLPVLRVPDDPGWERTGFGLRCPGRGVTRNKGRATALIRPLIARGELSVEMLIRTDDPDQTGPARIVSISRSPSLRDLTVGQQRDRIAVRVRTPRTGLNGSGVHCWSRPVLRAGRPTHVVATFANGTIRVYVHGHQARRPLHLYRASCLLLRNDHPAAGVLLGVLIGWPLGALAVHIVPRKRPILRATAAATLAPVMASLIASAGLDRAVDTPFVVALPLAAAIGAWMCGSRVLRDRQSER